MRVGNRSCDLSAGTTAEAEAGVSGAGVLPPRLKVKLNLPLIH